MTEPKTDEAVQGMKTSVRDEASKTGKHVADEAKAVASEAAGLGRKHAEQRFEQGKETIGGEVNAVGSALDDAAQRLHEQNSPLASYAEDIAGQISSFSSTLENTSLEGLATKTRRLARENPGLFVAGSVIAGIAASRFFKASDQSRQNDDPYGNDGYGAAGGGAYGAMGDTGSQSDDYLEGRRAALAGAGQGYRSPVTTAPQPRHDGSSMTTPPRAPMDSTSGATTGSSMSSTSGTAAPSSPTTIPGDTKPAGAK